MKKVLVYLLLTCAGLLSIFPFLWMFSSSFKTTGEVFIYPPQLIPPVLRLSNYVELIGPLGLARWFLNSTYVSGVSVALVLFFSSLAGFAFAKYDFRFRRQLFAILLGSMMIPFHIVLIPLFVLMINIHWVNTYQALIIPWCAGAFGIFMMRQYMVTLPDELLDAARMDGAGDFRIYWQIILPLARPALATLAIMSFMSSWNSFLWPLIVLSDTQKFTLPLGINVLSYTFYGESAWGQVMAASFISVIPVVILFIAVQKNYIAGLTIGSVKGV